MIDLDDDDDFFQYCLDLAVQKGRIKRYGNLKRTEPDDSGESSYVDEVTYELVRN